MLSMDATHLQDVFKLYCNNSQIWAEAGREFSMNLSKEPQEVQKAYIDRNRMLCECLTKCKDPNSEEYKRLAGSGLFEIQNLKEYTEAIAAATAEATCLFQAYPQYKEPIMTLFGFIAIGLQSHYIKGEQMDMIVDTINQ